MIRSVYSLEALRAETKSHAAHHLDSRVGHDPEDRGSSQTIEVCILGQISIQQVESRRPAAVSDTMICFSKSSTVLNLIYNHFVHAKFNGDYNDYQRFVPLPRYHGSR